MTTLQAFCTTQCPLPLRALNVPAAHGRQRLPQRATELAKRLSGSNPFKHHSWHFVFPRGVGADAWPGTAASVDHSDSRTNIRVHTPPSWAADRQGRWTQPSYWCNAGSHVTLAGESATAVSAKIPDTYAAKMSSTCMTTAGINGIILRGREGRRFTQTLGLMKCCAALGASYRLYKIGADFGCEREGRPRQRRVRTRYVQ